VLPQLQQLGIGSRMMEKSCEIIDQKKDAAYLETDRPENVPFYERFGFAVSAEEQILGVRNWFMWRSPH
jgi:predicted N-acetyltransferase YhbS